ncbi:TPA: DUF6572 domain-containing protein [Bacillus cereus]|uniref:Uncharacterized protein n=3 Tax=Bacillus cereus group TaxID=86661 RepID=A0AAN0SRQ7_BACCE|nr:MULTISPECIES: DUF6572 domain-containing protein [Bacillus cereus group]ABK88201.1 conserved hypothetical protein [Bacillus thuringiensis str. Al Hakam]AJH66289.1 hypothetical protein BF32_5445 [Bacillus thuringiensis]AJI08691.1 hypothetical protein AK40_6223 [Bacillus cereus 03BB108]EDX60254.1 conserved hypothetical protein [Bacillus cereus 03BB108]MCC2347157.1 hypothetical protein [Bacillus anthracis]
MALHDTDQVDLVLIDDENENNVYLTIFDALNWENEEIEGEHILLLQDKINTYLGFIESEEIYEKVPNTAGRKYFIIQVYAQHVPSYYGKKFYNMVSEQLGEAGYGFEFHHKPIESLS